MFVCDSEIPSRKFLLRIICLFVLGAASTPSVLLALPLELLFQEPLLSVWGDSGLARVIRMVMIVIVTIIY